MSRLGILSLVALTFLYAPVELTRMIWSYQEQYGWIDFFWLELPLIWVFYGLGLWIVWLELNKGGDAL